MKHSRVNPGSKSTIVYDIIKGTSLEKFIVYCPISCNKASKAKEEEKYDNCYNGKVCFILNIFYVVLV